MKANEFVRENGLYAFKHALAQLSFKPKIFLIVYQYECEFVHEIKPNHGNCVFGYDDVKRLVESHELVETLGGFERVKKVIDGRHIGYTHFYLHSNGRYVFLDHYVDFIPDHAQHIGMFNKAIADVESCMEVSQ